MTHLQNLQILKRVSSNFVCSCKTPLSLVGSLCYIAENPRFYRTKRIKPENFIDDVTIKEAQDAMLEYLHCTRNLQFMDAESMSKNSPHFLQKLLKKVVIDANRRPSISVYLCYHPINEFEPFFESLGLKPQEYSPFLPRDHMFLSDDDLLLENYHVLCNYGIARSNIGKIYKEAMEVFQYDYGVLPLKLKAYEEWRLSQSFMAKVVAGSPYLLIGDVNLDFIKVLEILRKGGADFGRIEEHLPEKSSYNWSQLLALLNLFSEAGFNDGQLGGMLSQHPWILLEDSVDRIPLLIGFLLKFGSTVNQICSIFLQFPQMQIGKFFSNLRRCFLFFNEIKMEEHEISRLFQSHSLLLGSCTLKKFNSLEAGMKRICEIILENPEILKKLVLGSKIDGLQEEQLRSQKLKAKFLLDIGFVKNSDKMESALKVFGGRGTQLKERFDCMVRAGLDRKDVCEMVKVCPQILNKKVDVLEMKIDFLLNEMGFPPSFLVNFPFCLKFTTQRVKLRVAMYNWLKDQGKGIPKHSLSTIITYSDEVFIRYFVNSHPQGPEFWEDLKKEI